MNDISLEVKESIQNNLSYLVVNSEVNVLFDGTILSKRDKLKATRLGFTVFVNDDIELKSDTSCFTLIYYSSDDVISVDNLSLIRENKNYIITEYFNNFQLEQLFHNLTDCENVKLADKRAVRMQTLMQKYSSVELEKEWGRYKYLVMEHSQQDYDSMRAAFSRDYNPSVVEFYQTIFKALKTAPSHGSFLNAVQHVWGYFKDCATNEEKEIYCNLESNSLPSIKIFLLIMAEKYHRIYLLDGYYFYQ